MLSSPAPAEDLAGPSGSAIATGTAAGTATGPAPAPPAPRARPRQAVVAAAATGPEAKGCLYALSQPPLMLFLCVIGALIGAGGAWDLLFL